MLLPRHPHVKRNRQQIAGDVSSAVACEGSECGDAAYQPTAVILREGFDALVEKLGPAGALRFMLHCDPGKGDYSQERSEILKDIDAEQAMELTEREM